MPKRRASPAVVDLGVFRARRQRAIHRVRIDRLLDANERTLGRLYETGALFSRDGARAGRDLLLIQQHLLKMVGLLDGLDGAGDAPAPRRASDIFAVYAELEELLGRTSELTARSTSYLMRLR